MRADSGPNGNPTISIVGGCQTSGRYTSDDIDIVGQKARIAPVLEKWGSYPRKTQESIESTGIVTASAGPSPS
jgi:hypothetical protein